MSTIRAHIAYGKTLILHKWGVLKGCRIMEVPLWRALIHDWTKFLPIEWFPYVKHFRNPDGSPRKIRNKDGSYDPLEQPLSFQKAWLHHQRNKHHWQAWVSIGDDGKLEPMPIPNIYLQEMVADWIGAGIAYANESNPVEWYEANKHKMVLCKQSRRKLDFLVKCAGEIVKENTK